MPISATELYTAAQNKISQIVSPYIGMHQFYWNSGKAKAKSNNAGIIRANLSKICLSGHNS